MVHGLGFRTPVSCVQGRRATAVMGEIYSEPFLVTRSIVSQINAFVQTRPHRPGVWSLNPAFIHTDLSVRGPYQWHKIGCLFFTSLPPAMDTRRIFESAADSLRAHEPESPWAERTKDTKWSQERTRVADNAWKPFRPNDRLRAVSSD